MMIKSTHWTGLLALTLVSAAGCREGSEGDDEIGDTETSTEGTDGTDTDTGSELAPTYWQDVAPIYFDNCVTCHSEGGIGPFVLDDYASAATWAPAAASAVESRQMPPWLVTSDGSCGDWANSKALEQAEIDTILAWVAADMPEGEPRDDLQVPEQPSLGGDAFEIVTPEFEPAPQGGVFAEFDEYRCFLFDPELEQDKFLTGYEVTPGNQALVHHVLTMPVDPDEVVDAEGTTNLQVIEALDAESPDRLGWPCFGAAGDNVSVRGIPVTWAPGQGLVDFPEGSGARIGAGDLLVTQIHYNMADPDVIGQTDSSMVRMRLEDSVEREGIFDLPDGLLETLFTGEPDSLPPGQTAYDYTWTLSVDDYLGWFGVSKLDLWGFFPHMHQFGVKERVRVLDAEGNEVDCIGDVQAWDFGWQLYYFYEQPIVLEAGQTIEVTCTFDTTGVDEAIWPGWGTQNEMCLAGLYVIPG
ncbi:hypothetical protein ACNOYE_07560 [Nannocystaceae bacterium ST9]